MSKKRIALCDGHGMSTAGKRTPMIPKLGRSVPENEFNRAVVKILDTELRRCGFETLLVAPGDDDVPLKTRTDRANAWKADLYVSIHYNALDGKFDGNDPEGHSIHIQPGSVQSRKAAQCILKYLVQGTAQKNRGIVEQNLHVTRETKMPAILSENGFMDNLREALLMASPEFQKEVAVEHAKGICDYFGVKYVPATSSTTPTATTPSGLYRVRKTPTDAKSQIGAYASKENAIGVAKKENAHVLDLSMKVIWSPVPPAKPVTPKPVAPVTPPPVPETKPVDPTPVIEKTSILGESKCTVQQLIQFVKERNPSFDPAIAVAFLEEGKRYGIRGDIAFCQSIHETGWFKFGGDVKESQHNYAGIGATGGVLGNAFPTINIGVRAQMQHLYAYASKNAIPVADEIVDPRFHLVTRGSAPSWEDLGGRWAYPGYQKAKYPSLQAAMLAKDTYGHKIIELYEQLQKVAVKEVPQPEPDDTEIVTSIKSQLDRVLEELDAERKKSAEVTSRAKLYKDLLLGIRRNLDEFFMSEK